MPHASNESLLQGNGFDIRELFAARPGNGLTFDDIIILPRYTETVPAADTVDLTVGLTPEFRIAPLISSPMDTVTEWRTAVQMALNGCLGILHINLSAEEAVRQVRRVKRFQMGFIYEPECRRPDHTVADARRVKEDLGFSTVLVTEDGTPQSRFLGLVTRSCIDFETDDTRPLSDVMVPRDMLALGDEDSVRTLEQARTALKANPLISKLPILRSDGSIRALVNRRNLVHGRKYPFPAMDANRQLLVGAAVTTHPEDDERTVALLEEGADAILIDSSQGGTPYMRDRIAFIRDRARDVLVIAGNVVTPGQAAPLLEAGADVLRVGMGSGSICITQGQYGLGRAQGNAIRHSCGLRADGALHDAPVIADGGIRHIGDMVKALALGASFVMCGRYIAGCDEAPGEIVSHEGRKYKTYRGMGSPGAMRQRGAVRYGGAAGYDPDAVVAQGVTGLVPAQGSLDKVLTETLAGIRGALRQLGCRTVAELHEMVRIGKVRFELRSDAARREGSVHDILVTAPLE